MTLETGDGFMTKFIIQNEIFGDEETNRLTNTLDSLNIDYDFGNQYLQGEFAIPRGSVEFIENFNAFNPHRPKFRLDNYTYTRYSKEYNKLLVNKEYMILPWWKLEESKNIIRNAFGGERIFIRPNSGKKIFTGTTLSYKWWEKELEIIAELPSSDNLNKHDLVIVAPYKKIEQEIRLFMHNRTCVDYSTYNGKEVLDRSALRMMQRNYGHWIDWFPDKFYTLDLALMDDGELLILEINGAFSSGWYDMDYEKVIKYIIANVPCEKCNDARWLWWNELDFYNGPANETGEDDTKYPCDRCML